ncbi:integrase catalytic domain-containing protein [Trichonephila clavipes]|nr:integrase catalytic domain-containing protein [Trichonephila clavipes]
MARRSKCAKLFSDNGKNFVGASNEIKKLLEIVRNPDEKLANYLAAEGTEWKFIPARSPNFGGLWEAAIISCKYHLKRVVNGINLTYEELLTIVRVQYFVRGGSVGHRSRASSKHLSPHFPVDELDSSGGSNRGCVAPADARVDVGSTKKAD